MVKIENVAKDYLEGNIELTTESGIEFSVDMDLEDLNDLSFIMAKQAAGKFDDAKANLKEQQDILKRILKKSYPSFNDKQINRIVFEHGNELLLEIQLTSGLRDRKSWEALKAKKQMELDKLTKDEPERTQSTKE